METIMLHKPEAGQSVQVTVQPGGVYRFDFYTEEVSFERSGDELEFHFSNGGLISLREFFTVGQQHDFTLELPDGTQVAGQDVAGALTMTLEDFHTDGHIDGPLAVLDGAAGAGAPSGLLLPRDYPFIGRELAALVEAEENGLAPHAPDGCAPALPRPAMLLAAAESEEVLHMDDLLSTTQAALPLPLGYASAFEAMVGTEVRELPPTEAAASSASLAADLADLDPDSLLLAFLRMGAL